MDFIFKAIQVILIIRASLNKQNSNSVNIPFQSSKESLGESMESNLTIITSSEAAALEMYVGFVTVGSKSIFVYPTHKI